MPSPITTSGFGVQVMPRIDFADPRLLAPAYGDILPNISRGAALVSQLQQIADEAQARPTRRQLQKIQLEEAQARLAQLPMARELAQLQIGEAQRRAAIPERIVEGVEITGGVPGLPEITGTFEDMTVTPGEISPLVRTTRGRAFRAGGVEEPFAKTETIKTGAQVAAEIAHRESLIAQREAQARAAEERLRIQEEYNRMRAQNEQLKAQAAMIRAEQLASNPAVGFVDVKRADGRTYRQYFNKATPNQIIHEIDRGDIGNNLWLPGANITLSPGASNVSPEVTALAAKYGGGAQTAQRPSPTAPGRPNIQTPEDIQAYQWALDNPKDPRSALILQRLGAR